MQKLRIIIFFILFVLPSVLLSQDLDKKISISVKNYSYDELINLISSKGDIHFSYNPQILPQKKVNLDIHKKSIRSILDQIFSGEGIEYKILENQVILRAAEKKIFSSLQKKDIHKYAISGFLRDKETGEPLIGANVYDKETFTGTTTNAYGFYSLTLPEGAHIIAVSYISYSKKEKYLDLKSDQQISIDLEPVRLEIKEVEVFSGKGKNFGADDGFKLTASELSVLPGFAGEQDVIRSLQIVPGIQNYGDGSGLYYVRGGNSDQNLMLIDDAPIFNPSHMFGFFSVLAPDAIREVDIYKGDFSAEYGGRLSSVIDIKAKNGNLKKFGISGNIGPYATALSGEGPVVKDRGSFFVSGRLSTINWLRFMNSTSTDFKMDFYDINAKLNYRINNNNRIFATFYYGNDVMERTTISSIITYGISWSNLAGIVRWNHTFNPRLFSNTTAYFSRYAYYLYTSKELKQYWTSSVENIALKNDLTWYISPVNTFKSGFELAYHHSNPGNVNFKFSDNPDGLKEMSKYNSFEYVLYGSDEFHLGKKIDVTAGLRLTLWQDIGPAKIYYFGVTHSVIDTMNIESIQTYAWYLRPEPRIKVSFRPDSLSNLRLSYARNTQFMQVLSNSSSPFTSLEIWTFSGPNAGPRSSDQVSMGYSRNLRHALFDFSADIYYKWITNNIDYADHAQMFYNPLIEGEVRMGKAWSYGLELMLRKQAGAFTGWIAYTWSRAFIQTREINNGEKYPAFYDRPHDFCINMSYRKGRCTVSANWLLMSGAAVTTPEGFYYYNGYSVPIYGKRNDDRLPVYHRLDLSFAYLINNEARKFQHSLILTLYNAYGRDNPFVLSFNRMKSGNDFVVPSNLSGGYQLVPTSLSVAGVIPSINYQFRF